MPAIRLQKLRQQVADLVRYYQQPDKFIRSLYDLLDFYSDRTRKPGQAATPPSLINSYNVPNPIIRQIVNDIQPSVVTDPEAVLKLCHKLWQEPVLEFRLLAASILGFIPLNINEDIYHLVELWSKDCEDLRILSALTEQSLTRYREESPEVLVKVIEDWLNSNEFSIQRIGLRALLPLLANDDFENMPVFYKLLSPYVRVAPPQLRPDILDAIQALARLSPQETAYFLGQNLKAPDNPSTAWLVRQSINHFPAETQVFLKNSLRSAKERKVE
jgi:hypothetical protein